VAVAHVAFLEDGAMAWRCLVQLGPEWFTWGSGMLFIWKMRIPEVFVPYRFDLFGASHQIHHLVCVFCAWWHLRNAEQMHTWRPVGEMPALF
jgi:predicted membrane channel-forming protein YqfA (hemolysin III family)